ncbi:MAG: hypothetical protein EOP53_07550 [Sphingobacteriales bacterium]|nr:MAG: hypothetical protein EOP53_07550 [Sphingobacteriales bacterium]
MKPFIFILFFLFSSIAAYPQQVLIKIAVTDSSLLPMENCYVKIYSLSKKAVLQFFNTGAKSLIEVAQKVDEPDTLLFTVTHINFKPFEFRLAVKPAIKQYFISAKLTPSTASLDEILLKSSPMWQKGDTTFYKVDAYKTGTERKLKDIISNLPNFNIANDGKLYFKNKLVSKITIENEDLMADKVDLLLNSFPVHVLDKIEAIENQQENKLLGGLEAGGQTIVNLSVKKNKLRTAFGDVEAGLGNPDKFLLKGTLFGLQNKMRLAAIFNNNNIGNGLTAAGKYELRNEELAELKNGQMQDLALRQISGIEQRLYIDNQQFDNRLQFNTPVNKTIPVTTELLYIADKQQQKIRGVTTFITDTSTITKATFSNNDVLPRIFKIGQKTQFNFRDSIGLKFGYSFYNENHNGLQLEEFFIFNDSSFKNVLQRSHTQNFILSAELTKRVSKRKATLISASFSTLSISQQSYTTSPDLSDIYFATNNKYDQSGIAYNQKATVVSVSTQFYRPKSRTVFKYEYWQPSYITKVTLQHSLQIFPDSLLQNLTGKDSSAVHELTAEYRRSLKIGIPLSATVRMGVADIIRNKRNYWLPLYSVNLGYKSGQDMKRRFEIHSSFTSATPQIFQLRTGIFPQQADGYVSYKNFNNAIQTFNVYSFYYYMLPNRKSSLSGYVSYNHSLQSVANNLEINSISSNYVYSLIEKPSTSTIASLRYFFQFFELSGSFTNHTAFTISNGVSVKSTIKSKQAEIKYKRNWKKKFYLDLSSNVSGSTFSFNGQDKNSFPAAMKWENKLKMNYKIRNINCEWNGNYVHNKINSVVSDAFIAEAGVYFIPSNKKISGSLFCYNMFNAKNYVTHQLYPTFQSVSTIPLIRRTLFFSLYYQL